MRIHKLADARSETRRNDIVATFYNCNSVFEAQERDRSKQGITLRDYFVTEAEWRDVYSPAAQKRRGTTERCGSFEDREAVDPSFRPFY